MCGRFLVSGEELKEILEAAEASADACMGQLSFTFRGGEVFPSDTVPVITANGVRFMTWGFPSILENQRAHINARSETAATSKTFGEAMAARRCIVPASAYFEWKQTGKKHKDKYEFTLPGRTPLYMAGIYTADGQFAILTREAASSMTDIHGRMPVILPKSLIGLWINQSSEVMSQAVTELQFSPVPASDMQPDKIKARQLKLDFGEDGEPD